MDAVDESRAPRAGFLEVLTTIGASKEYSHVSIIATGRLEADIHRAIGIAPEDKQKPPSRATSPQKRTALRETPGSNKRTRFDHDLASNQHGENSGHSRLLQGHVLPIPAVPAQDSGQSDIDPNSMDLDVDETPQPLATISASIRNGCTRLGMDNNYVRSHRELCAQQAQGNWILRILGEARCFYPRDKREARQKMPEECRCFCYISGLRDFVLTYSRFRLVSCQLEMLGKGQQLYNQKAVRETVDTMPTVIFDTYKGLVVRGISGANAQNVVARNALALICSSTSEIPCAEVLVEAARLDVSSNTSLIKCTLKNLRDLLGCLIKITPMKRRPDTVFQRNEEDVVFRQVLPAHYTVKEFVYDKTTVEYPRIGCFAQAKVSNLILELQIAWLDLTHWGQNRPANNQKTPTRFEEYCLKMTEKSLRLHRAIIAEEKSIYELVFLCLRYGSHHFPQLGRPRRAFPMWLQIMQPVVYQKDGSPAKEKTSVLISLLLLDWPELANKSLSALSPRELNAVWKDVFSLERRPQKDFATTSNLVVRPQITILKACVAL